MMKVNRNTINSDINYWYSILSKEWNNYDTDSWCMKQVHRLESQRARLFKELEKVEGTSLKLSIEKMILDVDTRMMNFVSKSLSISETVRSNTANEVNKWAKENHQKFRLVEASSLWYASKKTTQKIEKLLEEDWNNELGKM